ncbi:RNA polymerase sigma factor [Chitinophaga pinensis]|uniref:Sigma-70 family RNA polymerase sigma factor n=1 Tax=Chitinophaga pinensis TaxID=79329 RepID=A0A5C6LPL8_9BACT|nr:sigma-70 family RNA polymerase sigma factor [Chitinophaga pinensis]TWV99240.1 sigma-70 family RNA polymerase sigma factor [Chitinophaga pinensis]
MQHIDPAVWEACKAGDKGAYAAIYRLYYPRLYNYGYKLTDNVVLIEDSIQEIFVRFWINREQLNAIREFRSYLFVSFRHCLLRLLSQHRQQQGDLPDEEQYVFALEMSAEQQRLAKEEEHEQLRTLRSAMDHLTPRQREAIFFRFYENMDYDEIAAILQISVKATYKLMARAIEVLRSAYHTMPLVPALMTLATLATALGSLQLSMAIMDTGIIYKC